MHVHPERPFSSTPATTESTFSGETVLARLVLVELLGPNFQQKFEFGGRSMKFGVQILFTMLYLNIDRSKTF